jgi:hypothetical protein
MARPIRCVHDVYFVDDNELSRGGVGIIYPTTDARFVYKHYHDSSKAPARADLERLVHIGRSVLIGQGLAPGLKPRSSVNWPIDLRLQEGRVIGTALPRIPAQLFNEYGVRTLDFLILKRSQPPPAKQRIVLLLRMAEILQYVDTLKLIHGDINVKNLAWSHAGLPGSDGPVMYLIDCDGMVMQSPSPVNGVSANGWRDPRLTEGRIRAHDHYSDWYGLALAIYRGLMLIPGNLEKGIDGRWPTPSNIPPDMPAALREPLRLALSNPLNKDARLDPAGWVQALRTAYVPGGVFDEAAIRRLDVVASGPARKLPPMARAMPAGMPAVPRTSPPRPPTGPVPRITAPSTATQTTTTPFAPPAPTSQPPTPPRAPQPPAWPARPAWSPRAPTPLTVVPRTPARRAWRRVIWALVIIGMLAAGGWFAYFRLQPTRVDPAYAGHWEGTLQTVRGKRKQTVSIDITRDERHRWEPTAWFSDTDLLQCRGQLTVKSANAHSTTMESHDVATGSEQNTVCSGLSSMKFDLKSDRLLELSILDVNQNVLSKGSIKRMRKIPAVLPKELAGGWRGEVKQRDGETWTADLDLHDGAVGSVVGTSSYPTLDCSGELTLLRVSSKTAYVEEKITEPGSQKRCAPTVLIALRRTAPASATYTSVERNRFRGTLKSKR